MSEEKPYYVYVHRKATDGSVFYVGKGKGRRAWRKGTKGRNAYWHRTVNKHGFTVEILKRFYNEECAYTYERIVINLIGIDKLVNNELGGFGCPSGIPSKNRTPLKCSNGMDFESATDAAIWLNDQGFVKSSPSAILMAIKRNWKYYCGYGWSVTGERPDHPLGRIKEARVITNGNIEFSSMVYAVNWLKENGFPLARKGHISSCCNGKRNKAYGYKWEFLT
jgi:hypothetical protein